MRNSRIFQLSFLPKAQAGDPGETRKGISWQQQKISWEKRLSAIVFATAVVVTVVAAFWWVVKVPDIKVKALKLYAI